MSESEGFSNDRDGYGVLKAPGTCPCLECLDARDFDRGMSPPDGGVG